MNKNLKIQNLVTTGYITLLSILVVGAVGVAITTSLILLGLSSSRSSFALEQSYQAKAFANACAEEVLQQIRVSTSFTGSGSIMFQHGICEYTVTNTGGQNRTITASSTVGTIVKKVSVTIDTINPQINITAWQEVANF